jgi:hypothetical protein
LKYSMLSFPSPRLAQNRRQLSVVNEMTDK